MNHRIRQLAIDLVTLVAATILAFIAGNWTEIESLIGNPMVAAVAAAFVLNARREVRDYRERRKFNDVPFEFE